MMRRLDDLVGEIRALRKDLNEGYVRKDVLAAQEVANALQFKGLEDEHRMLDRRIDAVDGDLTNRLDKNDARTEAVRRLTLTAFVYPLVVGVVIVLITFALAGH